MLYIFIIVHIKNEDYFVSRLTSDFVLANIIDVVHTCQMSYLWFYICCNTLYLWHILARAEIKLGQEKGWDSIFVWVPT